MPKVHVEHAAVLARDAALLLYFKAGAILADRQLAFGAEEAALGGDYLKVVPFF